MKVNLNQYNWYHDTYTDKQIVKTIKSVKLIKSQKPIRSK